MSSTVTNRGAAALEVPEWAAVTLDARFDLHDAAGKHLVATVTAVEATPEKRVIHLHWSGNDGGPVDTIELTATTVRLISIGMERDAEFPPGEIATRRDGARCYVERIIGEGCIDHCSTRLCVDPVKGIVGGYGFAWPSDSGFRP